MTRRSSRRSSQEPLNCAQKRTTSRVPLSHSVLCLSELISQLIPPSRSHRDLRALQKNTDPHKSPLSGP